MKAMTDKEIKKEIVRLGKERKRISCEIDRLVKGRTVRVTCGYNGQEFGRSRPSQEGKVTTVTGGSSDGDFTWLSLLGERVSIHLKGVEFV